VAWAEGAVKELLTTNSFVFADRLSGTSFSPLNEGKAINGGASAAFVPDLATVASTPDLALEEEAGGIGSGSAADVLTLSGSSFTSVGESVIATNSGLQPVGLGEYRGAPLAIVVSELAAGNYQLQAESYEGSWAQLGGPLGIPPLPSENGVSYAGEAVATGPSSVPYVAFEEQQPGNESGEENLFVEAYTAGGVDPVGPPHGLENSPVVTEEVLAPATPGASATATFQPAASLDLYGSPAFVRHGNSITLNTGFLAACPRATATVACAATITLAVKGGKAASRAAHASTPRTTVLKLAVAIAAGKEEVVKATLSKAARRQLRAPRSVRGTVSASLTGPNGRTASISQPLAGRIP
jgi:hypothetical protein